MLKILFGIFTILHGLVHLLYFGQSARFFELQPGMTWPNGGWLLSNALEEKGHRKLASAMLVLAAVGFAAAGIGILAGLSWWQPVLSGAAILSSAIFIVFWNGTGQDLANQGAVGILINLAILAAAFVIK